MALNNLQKIAYEKAIQGHSLLILGQSGTGKSFLTKEICKSLCKDHSKTVGVTATTGIASINIHGQTIHSWCGVADGRFSNDELVFKVNSDDCFIKYKKNIQDAHCLVIDEISMLSVKLFEQIEFLCRKVRKNDLVFGGLQIICVGDFFQLPPVPDNLKNDRGDFCFTSKIFKQIFTHTIILKEVIRHHQQDFIQAVNEVSRGDLSQESHDLIRRLKRPLPPGPDPIRLCARNFDCFIFNAMKLVDVEGAERTYNSTDSGEKSKLEKLPVPQTLHLKVGCPIMLLKNLSDTLVNGLRGKVVAFSDKNVIVEMQGVRGNCSITAELKPEQFMVYSCYEGKVIASRFQLPICLAYAITIHKAQGLTLGRVEVDATNIFAPGQLGVAIGRTTEKKNLRVLGFKESCVLKHQSVLYEFYESCNNGVTKYDQTLSCCQTRVVDNTFVEQDVDFESDDELSDFSEGEMDEIDFMLSNDTDVVDSKERDPIEPIVDINAISASFKMEMEKCSPRDKEIYKTYFQLVENSSTRNDVEYFANKLHKYLKDIFDKNCSGVMQFEPKVFTKFYSGVYKYSVTLEYRNLVVELVHRSPSTQDYDMCGKIFDYITSWIIREKANTVVPAQESNVFVQEMSVEGKGKLRYVFGRCIAKARYSYMKKAKTHIYKLKTRIDAFRYFCMVKLLDSLTATYSDLEKSSKFKETLYQTQRKQNLNQGLTNINDHVFEFMLKVESTRVRLQTQASVASYGSDALNRTRQYMENEADLRTTFRDLFHDLDTETMFQLNADDTSLCLDELFKDLLIRFLRITDNEFRKSILRSVGKAKTERLRQKVDNKQQKQQKSLTFPSLKEIKSDKTEHKLSSHLRLKNFVLERGNQCLDHYSKKEMLQLCKAYGLNAVKQSMKKSTIRDTLCSEILSADIMVNSSELDIEQSNVPLRDLTDDIDSETVINGSEQHEPTSNTLVTSGQNVSQPASGKQRKSKRKRKVRLTMQKNKKKCKETETKCPVCDVENPQWVACDLCDDWFCRDCLKLTEEQWAFIAIDDWYCPSCLK